MFSSSRLWKCLLHQISKKDHSIWCLKDLHWNDEMSFLTRASSKTNALRKQRGSRVDLRVVLENDQLVLATFWSEPPVWHRPPAHVSDNWPSRMSRTTPAGRGTQDQGGWTGLGGVSGAAAEAKTMLSVSVWRRRWTFGVSAGLPAAGLRPAMFCRKACWRSKSGGLGFWDLGLKL